MLGLRVYSSVGVSLHVEMCGNYAENNVQSGQLN